MVNVYFNWWKIEDIEVNEGLDLQNVFSINPSNGHITSMNSCQESGNIVILSKKTLSVYTLRSNHVDFIFQKLFDIQTKYNAIRAEILGNTLVIISTFHVDLVQISKSGSKKDNIEFSESYSKKFGFRNKNFRLIFDYPKEEIHLSEKDELDQVFKLSYLFRCIKEQKKRINKNHWVIKISSIKDSNKDRGKAIQSHSKGLNSFKKLAIYISLGDIAYCYVISHDKSVENLQIFEYVEPFRDIIVDTHYIHMITESKLLSYPLYSHYTKYGFRIPKCSPIFGSYRFLNIFDFFNSLTHVILLCQSEDRKYTIYFLEKPSYMEFDYMIDMVENKFCFIQHEIVKYRHSVDSINNNELYNNEFESNYHLKCCILFINYLFNKGVDANCVIKYVINFPGLINFKFYVSLINPQKINRNKSRIRFQCRYSM